VAPAKKGQTSSSMTQRVADSGMDSGPLLSGVDATLSRKRFPLKRNVWQWRSGYRLPKEPAEQKSSAADSASRSSSRLVVSTFATPAATFNPPQPRSTGIGCIEVPR